MNNAAEIDEIINASTDAARKAGEDVDRVYHGTKENGEFSIGDDWDSKSFWIVCNNGQWAARRRMTGEDTEITFDKAKQMAVGMWMNG